MRKHPLEGVTIPGSRKGKLRARAPARRSRLQRELTEERARWRNRRRICQFKQEAITYCVFERNEWTLNSIRERCTDHIDLRCRRSQILFLLRILPLADYVTKRARMCAIKRLSNRPAQRRVPGVINHHCCPCERLQSDPMQTNRQTKCADRGDPTSAAKHDCEAKHRLVSCQLSPARLQPQLQSPSKLT